MSSSSCDHRSLELNIVTWTIECMECHQIPYSKPYMYDLIINILMNESWPNEEILWNEAVKIKRIVNLYRKKKDQHVYILDNELEIMFVAIERVLRVSKEKDTMKRLELTEKQLKGLKLRVSRDKSIGIITKKEFEGLALLRGAQQQFLRFVPRQTNIIPLFLCKETDHRYHLGKCY